MTEIYILHRHPVGMMRSVAAEHFVHIKKVEGKKYHFFKLYPNAQTDASLHDGFPVETDGRNRFDEFASFQLVEDARLTDRIETDH